MKKVLLSTVAAAAFAVGTSHAQLITGSDNAGNYSDGDLNGQNLGTGFGAWSVVTGTNGFAGTYLTTNTTQNGRASIGSGTPLQVFGMYANNGTNNNAFIDLRRTFAGNASMVVGDSFSWQGSFSWFGGNRGFSLFSGGTNFSGELLNLNYGGNDALTYSSVNAGVTNSGTGLANIFNVSFTATMTFLGGPNNNLRLQLAGGTNAAFDQTFALAGTPNSFKWYFAGAPAADGGNYEPFINNLITVPEPSTYALLALSAAGLAGYAARRRARK